MLVGACCEAHHLMAAQKGNGKTDLTSFCQVSLCRPTNLQYLILILCWTNLLLIKRLMRAEPSCSDCLGGRRFSCQAHRSREKSLLPQTGFRAYLWGISSLVIDGGGSSPLCGTIPRHIGLVCVRKMANQVRRQHTAIGFPRCWTVNHKPKKPFPPFGQCSITAVEKKTKLLLLCISNWHSKAFLLSVLGVWV